MVLARVVSKMASSMRNGPFFCIQTFWRRFMVTNEAANSFPAEKKTKDRKKKEQGVEDDNDPFQIRKSILFVCLIWCSNYFGNDSW